MCRIHWLIGFCNSRHLFKRTCHLRRMQLNFKCRFFLRQCVHFLLLHIHGILHLFDLVFTVRITTGMNSSYSANWCTGLIGRYRWRRGRFLFAIIELGQTHILRHTLWIPFVIFLKCARIFFQIAVFNPPNFIGNLTNESSVMRHKQATARIVYQWFCQHRCTKHIQVVRGLIQQQKIGLGDQCFCQSQPRFFTTTQYLNLLKYLIACEQETTQYRPQLPICIFGAHRGQFIQQIILQIQGLQLVLGKKCRFHIPALLNDTTSRLRSMHHPQYRWFSLTVGTHQGNFIAPQNLRLRCF